MNAAALAFRFRVAIFLLLYLLGFLPPWGAVVRGGSDGTLWLAASTLAARSGWIGLAAATVTVTLIALACLAIGWPSDPATREMVAWGRRQQALPVRVTALGAVLGVLRRALTASGAPVDPLPGAQPVSEDERNWLIEMQTLALGTNV